MKEILTLLVISMIPSIELRGAIPYGILKMNLDTNYVLLISIIGNLLPIPFIYLFAHRLLLWGENIKYIGTFCKKVLKKGHSMGEKLEKKAGIALYISLMLFVAIPIPGTGVWTATLAASLLDLNFKKVFISLSIGVLIAAFLVSMIVILGIKIF